MSYIVHSGEVSSGVLVSYDDMTVLDGGTAIETNVDSYGSMYVSSGGLAVKTTVCSEGFINVSAGGLATETVISSGGSLYILFDGKASDITVKKGGYLAIKTDEVVSGIDLSSGGCVEFGGKVSVSDLQINSGGQILALIHSGNNVARINGAIMNYTGTKPAYPEIYGIVSGLNFAGANLYIATGGTGSDTVIGSGGRMYVSSGGMATDTTVSIYGRLVVSSGGKASVVFDPWHGTIQSAIGAQVTYLDRDAAIYYGGPETGLISKWDEVKNFTITAGNSMLIYTGGTATNTMVSAGLMHVSFGGSAIRTTVTKEGRVDVDFFGTVLQPILYNGGRMTVLSGGVVSGADILGNGYLNFEGKIAATGIQLHSGGTIAQITHLGNNVAVIDGAIGRNADTFTVYGKISGLNFANADLRVASGGTATNTEVNSNGRMTVSSGGTATDTKVNSDGTIFVSNGGNISGTDVLSGGSVEFDRQLSADTLQLHSGGRVGEITHLGNNVAQINGAIIESAAGRGTPHTEICGIVSGLNFADKELYIASGGTATDTVVGGRMIILSNGIATGTVVNSDGTIFVSNGGNISGTDVLSGGSVGFDGQLSADTLQLHSGGRVGEITHLGNNVARIDGTVNTEWDMTLVNGTISGLNFADKELRIASDGTATNTEVNSNGRMTVFSGGMATDTTINSRGDLSVLSGGTATDTVVGSDGRMTVSSGGTAIHTLMSKCDDDRWAENIKVESGGVALDTELQAHRRMQVEYGGVVSGVNVLSGGYLELGGATTTDIQLHSGGRVGEITHLGNNVARIDGTVNAQRDSITLANGTISGLNFTGRELRIVSGGTASDTVVGSYGRMTISSGGTAIHTLMSKCDDDRWEDNIKVESGGVALDTELQTHRRMQVEYGGVVSGVNVLSGGYLELGGATTTDIQLHSGGRVGEITHLGNNVARIDGTVNAEWGRMIIANGTISGLNFADKELCIASGGTATDTVVNSNGTIYVESNGIVSGVDVLFGGYFGFENTIAVTDIQLHSGGRVREITHLGNNVARIDGVVNTEGDMTLVNGTISGLNFADKELRIASDGTATNTKVNSNGHITVSSGGTVIETTVKGRMEVSSGGRATNTTVEEWGHMFVSSGGTAFQIKENGGYVEVDDGADVTFVANAFLGLVLENGRHATVHSGTTATNTTVNWGDLYVFSGGTATDTVVNSCGSMTISSGGTALQIKENGGYVEVADGADVTFVANVLQGLAIDWGMTVHSGTTATDTTVYNGGHLHVSSGGTATDTTVDYRGNLSVSSGGTALQIKENGGYVDVADGADVTFVANVLQGLAIDWGMTVHSGTTATDTTVNQYGDLCVYSGGTALQIKENGGYVEVADGADVTFVANAFSGLNLGWFRRATIHSGTTATDTTVDYRGNLSVSSGGIATDTTVNQYGKLCVYSGGTATGIVAQDGAYIDITVAPDTYIQGSYNGSAFEMKDAFISGYTVNGGGNLSVSSGGIATDTTVNQYGNLFVSSGGVHTGNLHIADGARVSTYTGAIIDFTVARQSDPDTALITNWNLISGGNDATYTLSVKSDQFGKYILATHASDFACTVTVKLDDTAIGTVSCTQALLHDGVWYTLNLNENNDLVLTVEAKDSSVYVNSDWAGLTPGATVTLSDGTSTAIFGTNAFATTKDAKTKSNPDPLVFDGGTYKTVFAGNEDKDTRHESRALRIDGGTFGSVFGGNGMKFGTKGVLPYDAESNVKVCGGSIKDYLVAGDYVLDGNYAERTGNNILTVSGGEIAGRVIGGTLFNSKVGVTYGNVSMTLAGGTFTSRIYGGNACLSHDYSGLLDFDGNISITLDASQNALYIGENIVCGSYGYGVIHGNVTLTVTGTGENLAFGENSTVSGGSGDGYFSYDDQGNRTYYNFVEKNDKGEGGLSVASFNGFSGDFGAKIVLFDKLSFEGASAVHFTNNASYFTEIGQWSFAGNARAYFASEQKNDFKGDTLVIDTTKWNESPWTLLSGDETAFAGFDAFGSVTIGGVTAGWDGSQWTCDGGLTLSLNDESGKKSMILAKA